MARVAFAWELGGEYGHVVSCAGLGAALERRGHAIGLMFRELQRLSVLPETAAWEVFQAPHLEREGEGIGRPVSFAEILLGCGYADPRVLSALLARWREMLSQWKPDLVIADFAPTALLAARTLGIPRVTYGNGFFLPPRREPLPPFRIDEPVDPGRVARADAAALASVNAALAGVGSAPLARLADLFDSEEDFLCTFPEIDHYGTRDTAGYWGPRLRSDLGHVVDWPKGRGKRVFVYVKPALPQLDTLIDLLASRPHRVLAFIPGLDAARRARLASPARRVIDRPVRIDAAFRGCDLLVSHGGEIAAGAACSGVPALLFPSHYEQFLLSLRLQQLGCARWLPMNAGPGAVVEAFDGLLANPRVPAAARAFAQRYPAYSPVEQRRRIVQRIEAILSPTPTPAGPAP